MVALPEDESGGARAGIPPVGHSPQVWRGEHQDQLRLGHTSTNGALLPGTQSPREGDKVEAGTVPLTWSGCRTCNHSSREPAACQSQAGLEQGPQALPGLWVFGHGPQSLKL